MHKWKIGDKVRILDASKIAGAESGGYLNDNVYKVVELHVSDGSPMLEALEKFPCDTLCFFDYEKPYYELVE